MKLPAVLCASMLLAACAATGPAYDPGPRPDVGGAIAGRVSTNDGATALGGRKVTAVNLSTGARYDVSTATNGGYTVRLPVGMYRLEVELKIRRDGDDAAGGDGSRQGRSRRRPGFRY